MICFRLLDAKDPAQPLADAVRALAQEKPTRNTYQVDPVSYRKIPNAPFAYWASNEIRKSFYTLPPFESDGRTARQGLATADDFRFLRTAWETSIDYKRAKNKIWFSYAKGGNYSPFYTDIFLKVNWAYNGSEIKNNLNEKGNIRSNVWMLAETESRYFFQPGLTWPLRSSSFSPQVLPKGCIFSARGYSILAKEKSLLSILGVTSSKCFDFLFKLLLGRMGHPEFIIGSLQKIPFTPEAMKHQTLEESSIKSWSSKRSIDSKNLTSHAFYAPALAPSRVHSTPDSK